MKTNHQFRILILFISLSSLSFLSSAQLIELGENDFRISEIGGTGDNSTGATEAAIAYNSTTNQYLVAWHGSDINTMNAPDEIFGQIINADGTVAVDDFRISDAGDDNDPNADARVPSIAYNPITNQYLVVWRADDIGFDGIVDGEREIFGQLINADGSEAGVDFRISDAGGTGNADADANAPEVAYNPTTNQYLVVWWADDTDFTGIVDNENEIFGQLINADGSVALEDFRISDTGGTGNPNISAFFPDLTYNPTTNQYLVVWYADDTDFTGIVDGENEIFGQIINADGSEAGVDFRISDAGGTGDSNSDAFFPDVVYNPSTNQYLVVWHGDDIDFTGIVSDENEIFGQIINADGSEAGVDFRISDVGGTGNGDFDAFNAQVIFYPGTELYLVLWDADDIDFDGIVENELEIFGQLINADGSVALATFRISDVGGTGNDDSNARNPGVGFNPTTNQFLAVWNGVNLDIDGIVESEEEIYGQFFTFVAEEEEEVEEIPVMGIRALYLLGLLVLFFGVLFWDRMQISSSS